MAAGLGFKDFTTGEVLTAADVDGYLMQGVWVFADAAARTAAVTSPQEGNISFLKDTNSTEYYSGSAWVAIGGSVPTSLEFTAGKNKIINGDFYINQRNFTSVTTAASYGFDRWFQLNFGTSGTCTYTPQTFTAGAAPVAGYEGKTFAQLATTMAGTDTNVQLVQSIEDVRTLAGSTATLSFWARATAGTPKLLPFFEQNFGSGGSPSASVFTTGTLTTISTTWTRYSMSIAIPSISGKTIGTNANTSFLSLRLMISCGSAAGAPYSDVGVQSNTFQFWGVQLEAGSTATAFQTATGTLQGELAACQRYYYRHVDGASQAIGVGYNETATALGTHVKYPVTMRITPSLVVSTGAAYYTFYRNGANDDFNSFTLGAASPNEAAIYNNSEISGTAGHAGNCYSNNASASVAFNSEL